MDLKSLGSTGLSVPRLGLGVIDLKSRTSLGEIEFDAPELIRYALNCGINFFDTADIYAEGELESILGKALHTCRHEAIICTKVGLQNGPSKQSAGLSRRHILWSIDQSLRRLKTDWIDLYVLHTEDTAVEMEETLLALDHVVRSGKARHIGFSNWSAWKVASAVEFQKSNGLAQFSHGQVHYSVLARDIENEFVPLAARYGLGLVIWGPLACGFLTGRYTRQDLESGLRTHFEMLPFDRDHGFAVVAQLDEIGKKYGATPAQVAIAWLIKKQHVSSILVGMSSRKHLDENVAAADLKLSADDVLRLDTISPPAPIYPHWLLNQLTGK
jgi:aryl-alcohol dehydrogenase-like predicted oxidoreductase